MSRSLIIGSVTVPVHSVVELSQTYSELAARRTLRMADGTGVLRTAWSGKLATDIRGSGTIPAGLLALNYSAAMTVKCVAPRALTQATAVFANVTTNRRTDTGATPYGRATVDGKNWVPTSVTWATNQATLGTVSGATAYQLVYYPQFSAYVTPPSEDWDWQGNAGWSLQAEEV